MTSLYFYSVIIFTHFIIAENKWFGVNFSWRTFDAKKRLEVCIKTPWCLN